MSSISAMSTATNRNSGHKRNSDGSLRVDNSTICLADIPTEQLKHIASFLSATSQAIFGLAVAAAKDKILNKNSFAIVGDQWDSLDFEEIEKELTARLTDDDIKAVLWCIDAANKVKRLSLAHCVNITGAGLQPLLGSTVIEQIDVQIIIAWVVKNLRNALALSVTTGYAATATYVNAKVVRRGSVVLVVLTLQAFADSSNNNF